MSDKKEKEAALRSAAAQQDGGLAQQLVRENEEDAPDQPEYADPTKGSSTKPGTRALAREAAFQTLQAEQQKAAQDKDSQARTMGMSKARREAYATAEEAGNK